MMSDDHVTPEMHDLIIIGGGPAALSAAVFALGKQLDFVMIYQAPGGKAGWRQRLAGQIEDEFLAGELAVRGFEHQIIMRSGRAIRDRVISIVKQDGAFRVQTERYGVEVGAAVIVATGATPLPLDAPGARKLVGRGLGYSPTTHAHLVVDRSVAVVGCSERALRGAGELACTAAQVYLIVPDPTCLLTPLGIALRGYPNLEVLEGYHVIEITGETNVETLLVARGELVRELRVDAAFVDLGLLPNSALVQDIVLTDEQGFIKVDERNATTLPGLFAAGDVTTAFGEQVLIAIGDGARAGLSAYDYLLARRAVRRVRFSDVSGIPQPAC
jgi:thioredoxin reductase (NADPH)